MNEPGTRTHGGVDDTAVVRFRRHLRIERHGSSLVALGEQGLTTLRGAAPVAVAALVDGRRDLRALIAARPPGASEDDVRAVVGHLVTLGLVDLVPPERAGCDALEERAGAYWDAGSAPGRLTCPGPPSDLIAVIDLGDRGGSAAVAAALEESHFTVRLEDGTGVCGADRSAAPAPGLSVVVCTDYLDPRLSELDMTFRTLGRPWLLVRPGGVRLWIGPLFGAERGGGPCWSCLSERLWGHRRGEACLQAAWGRRGPAEHPVPALAATLTIAAGAVALEAAAWAHDKDRPIRRGVWTFDTAMMEGRLHHLRARPQCPSCGDPGLVARMAEIAVILDGAEGTAPDGDTADVYVHLVSPVTGVVADLRPEPHAVAGMYAVRTGPTASRRIESPEAMRGSLRTPNGGAGADERTARNAAIGEAVERFCGEFHSDMRRVPGSLQSLGPDAVDPRDCLLVHPWQYAGRAAWNVAHGLFNQIPAPVRDDEVVDWTPLWSLRDGRRRLLPTSLLYHGCPGPSWARSDSNGCAAGPTRDEAVRRGLLELVERDAVALWWYNRTTLRGVDLASARDPWVAAAAARHAAAGRELRVLDATSDLGVPVLVAVSWRRIGGAGDRVMMGFGADSDPSVALARAVAELSQLMPLVTEGAQRHDDPDTACWVDHATIVNQPWLQPAGTPGDAIDLADVALSAPADGAQALVERLVAHDLNPMVLDQTRPDVGLPVVRTVVPTLRPFWARFAPGRLYDVPVAIGRVSSPTPLEALNPIPLFL